MKRIITAEIGSKSILRKFVNIIAISEITRWTAMFAMLVCLTAFTASVRGQEVVKFTQGSVNESATLSLGVQLGNYKGRGLDLPVSMTYSSSVWRIDHIAQIRNYVSGYNVPQQVTQAIYAEHSAAGWKSSLELPKIEFPKHNETYSYQGKPSAYDYGGGCYGYRIAKVFIHMPDGSTTELRKSDTPHHLGYVDMSGTFYAIDGSRMRFDATGADTGTLYTDDGTRYVLGHPYSYVIDRNGNTLTYNESNRQWTDTAGRTIVNPIPASPAAQDYYYSVPSASPGGTMTYTFKWRNLADVRTPDSNNSVPALRYMAAEYLPNPWAPPVGAPNFTNFPQLHPSGPDHLFQSEYTYDIEGNPSLLKTLVVGKEQSQGQLFNPVVLSEIVLPDGTKYQFTYNIYGEIDKVVYPTNAFEKYEYDAIPVDEQDTQPYVQADRKMKSRKLSVDGTGNDMVEWKYIESRHYGGILDEGGIYRKTSIIAPDKTRTEVYKKDQNTGNVKLGFTDSRNGSVVQRKIFSTSTDGLGGTLLRREITQYEQTTNTVAIVAPCGQGTYTTYFSPTRNPRPNKQVSITFEGSGSALAQTSIFSYDTTYQLSTGLDMTGATTYNFAVIDNTTAQNGTIGQISTGSVAKTIETTYVNDGNYLSRNILGLSGTVYVKNGAGTVLSQTETYYDEVYYYPLLTYSNAPIQWSDPQTDARGNPTTVKTYYDIPSYLYTQTHNQFDLAGNARKSWDAKGNVSEIRYDDNFTDSVNRNSYSLPTKTISAVPDSSGQNGSSSAFETMTKFDFNSALPRFSSNENGQSTEIKYDDSLQRPSEIVAPNGQRTLTEYGIGTTGSNRFVKVKTQIDASHWKEVYTWSDGLSRTVKTQQVNTDGDVFVELQYDNMGREKKVTNPYRSGETVVWAESFYDDLGRAVKIKTPDNAEINTAYSLATAGSQIGTTMTVTDQASKQKRSITNGLGHTIRVDEPNDSNQLGAVDNPNLPTVYSYDAIDNLLSVTQGGQARSFQFDALSRLKQSTNPESGTTTFSYDNNGNITGKTDARGVVTSYTYDTLNRVKTRSHSDSTPTATYFYDGAGTSIQYAKGRVTKISSSVSTTEYTAFDNVGRVLSHKQTTDGQPYTTSYAYNLSGAVTEETYPSGKVIRNTFDADNQLSQIQGRSGNKGFWTYANGFTYNSSGGITSTRLGNGRWESAQFNSRLQPVQLGLGTTQGATNLLKLEYTYGTWESGVLDTQKNNGNLGRQIITAPTVGGSPGFTATQTFAYDQVNRIKDATETISGSQSWRQAFTYDRYGNRNFDEFNTTTLPKNCLSGITPIVCPADRKLFNPAVNTANNRLSSSDSYTFDSSGNLTIDAAGRTFTYNADNKQLEVKNSSSQTIGQYLYDADGKRVKKVVPATGEITIFVYDASGTLVEEFSTVQSPTPRVSFLTADNLRSPRVSTDQNGAVVSRHDYHPFGEEIVTIQRSQGVGYAPDDVRNKFTGYERDTESGLDFAQARYLNSSHGRFTSSDPQYFQFAMAFDPQRFNLYIYARNNPLKWIDPDGEKVKVADGSSLDDIFNMVGGEAIFNQFFEIVNGQISVKKDVDLSKANDGVKMLAELIQSPETFLVYLGANAESVARLFEGTVDDQGKLNDKGKAIAKEFKERSYIVSTRGRPLSANQPANGVFTVLAINPATFNLVQTGVSSDTETDQSGGLNQTVKPVSLMIHELAENLDFSVNGTGANAPKPDESLKEKKATRALYDQQVNKARGFEDYARAHRYAIRREAKIRNDIKTITGGYAGGSLERPKEK